MWENLQHNVGQEFEESLNAFEFHSQSEKNNTLRQYNGRFTLMDLVKIFTDEAGNICKNNSFANLIALESLRDYIKNHVSNVKIVL
jgi:hypothetical protein